MSGSIPKIKQGGTFTMSITLGSELGERDLYIGFYGNTSKKKILFSTSSEYNALVQDEENPLKYTATFTNEMSKQMAVGLYNIELLIKSEDGSFTAISDPVQISIVESRIGKEV